MSDHASFLSGHASYVRLTSQVPAESAQRTETELSTSVLRKVDLQASV